MTTPEWLDELMCHLLNQRTRERDGLDRRTKEAQLDRLLERVAPENLHGEVDTGLPIGREVW